jgi:Icc-related predicted phosphoesterase
MQVMKIVAVGDLHGVLPGIPPCDLLLLAGDLCPLENHALEFQADWLNTRFRRWLEGVPARRIVGVAGNHDFLFERAPEQVPRDLPWTYLQDSGLEWEGWRIWGTPWQPWFYDWAFNLSEEELQKRWQLIPDGTDILVLHGPPWGYGDGVPERTGLRRCGSRTLLERIEQIRPRLVVFGHIHEGRGESRLGSTVLANVTVLDGSYEHVHPPWQHELSR